MQSNSNRQPVNSSAVSINSLASLSVSLTSATAVSSYFSSTSSSLLSFRKCFFHYLVICLVLLGSVSPRPVDDNDPENHLDTNGTDILYNDQPPRLIKEDTPANQHWSRQPHERIHHLMANDYYLTIKDGKVYGTLNEPINGIFRFLTENSYLVLKHYSSNERFFCLNDTKLYLSESLNSDCYLNEIKATNQHYQYYQFVKYQKYLGINCEPLIGSVNDTSKKSFMFQYRYVKNNTAHAAKHKPWTEEPIDCNRKTKKEIEDKKRQLREKLTTRWCWNLNRMSKNNSTYISKCKKKYCDKSKTNCVCDRLIKMLHSVKRWKRKCLARRVNTWIIKKHQHPNVTVVMEVSRRLLPVYPNIARRFPCTGNRSNCTRRDKTAVIKPLKINPLLEDFKQELFSNGRIVNKTDVSLKMPRKPHKDNKSISVLSTAFRERIEKLLSENQTSRHRRKNHKRRKHDRTKGRSLPKKKRSRGERKPKGARGSSTKLTKRDLSELNAHTLDSKLFNVLSPG